MLRLHDRDSNDVILGSSSVKEAACQSHAFPPKIAIILVASIVQRLATTFVVSPPPDLGLEWGGGCTHVVHGLSRMTIDPRAPTMPGRNTSWFYRQSSHCMHQARSAVKGVGRRVTSILRMTAFETNFLAYG